MGFEMTFYHEDGRESIFDDKENEANQYDEIPSLCLKKITDLRKMVKNDIYFASQLAEEPDANMTEVSLSCNLVRTSVRLANERIHESFVNSRKRKASESIENAIFLFLFQN